MIDDLADESEADRADLVQGAESEDNSAHGQVIMAMRHYIYAVNQPTSDLAKQRLIAMVDDTVTSIQAQGFEVFRQSAWQAEHGAQS